VGKIVTPPTPEEVRISEEKQEDYSVNGRLKKHKERTKKEE